MGSNFEFQRNFYNSFLNFQNDKNSNAFKIKNQESLLNQIDNFKGDFQTHRENYEQEQLMQTIEDRFIAKDAIKNHHDQSLFSSKRKTADSENNPNAFDQDLKNQVEYS